MVHDVRRGERSYELLMGGEVAVVADYADDGAAVTLPHVQTAPRFRTRGLASVLVGEVLERLADGRRVRPPCPFVVAYVRDDPEVADLL